MGLFSKKAKFPEIEQLKKNGFDAKRWMTEGDANVCPVCRKANGQIKPLNEPFELSDGQKVMCPGDPAYKHDGKCRCSILGTKLSYGSNGTF